MPRSNSNQGIIVNGGSINAGNLAVGAKARAISIGAREPDYSTPPPVMPADQSSARLGSQPAAQREWDAFLSHAHEDKAFVRPLAQSLLRRGLRIWYDDAALDVGNSLRESIDLAITQSRFGIVVFSRYYFAKDWTRQEVNALVSREVGGIHVVLPIWHNVSPAEVLRFSPILADRVAARSSEDLEVVAEKLARAIRNPQEPEGHV